MKIIIAIIRQTIREALRSRVFHALLILTLLAAALLPLTVTGDGSATAAIQAILTYSLQAVTVLLTLAAVWLGCAGLSREIESHRIHMILTKPVHPWMAWTGKWLAVLLINGVVLALASGMIFMLIHWRVNAGDFSDDDLLRARNEVMSGRRVYEPNQPDFNALAEAEYQRLLNSGDLSSDHNHRLVMIELRNRIRARATEVQPHSVKRWRFERVRVDRRSTVPLYFRYRVFVATTTDREQRETRGVWRMINPDAPEGEGEAFLPVRNTGGMFYEVIMPASLIARDGSLVVEYQNRDPMEDIVIFQVSDGPTIMVPVSGFAANYWRGVAIVFLRLGFFAALGCALGVMFSGPVALFLAFTYMAFSILIDGAIGSGASLEPGEGGIPFGHNAATYVMMLALDKIVISLQEFDIPDLLANGRLVSGLRIGSVALFQLLLRGGPLAAVSILVFSRREMGKVVRQ